MNVLSSSSDRGGATLVNNVQGLRAVAAILVVLAHLSLAHVGIEELVGAQKPWLGAFSYIGLCGVDLFFVISGFIMLVTNWNSFGKQSAGVRFFVRRAIRIYPPYWLALLPALAALLLAPSQLMVSHVGARTGFVQSILLVPNPNKFVLTVAWTLVWEMLFYVVFAFLLKLDRRYVLPALGAWLAIELTLNFTCGGSGNFYVHFVSSPLPVEFIFGALIGLLYVERRMPAPWVLAGIACACTAIGWSIVVSAHAIMGVDGLTRIALFGIPAALLVYSAVALELSGAFLFPVLLTSLGNASYAIYLWHISILVALRQVIERLHPAGAGWHLALIILSFAIVVAAGQVVYHVFERPVTSYLNGVFRKVVGSAKPRAAARFARVEAAAREA
jgi:peptidoglycan/LPS O-acetylase OafA/YrhL